MNAGELDSDLVGRITHGPDAPNQLVSQTIEFVRDRLPEWRDDPTRPDEESEERLNAQLCKFLNTQARRTFPMTYFHHEEYQSGRRRVDLSALPTSLIQAGLRYYTIYDPFLAIEGKRIPAPSSDREREYVTGSEQLNGGIQRFKLGLHGAQLETGVIVGYVQEGDRSVWFKRVNGWIQALSVAPSSPDWGVWTEGDLLFDFQDDFTRQTSTSISDHSRIGDIRTDSIRLHHLWVSMDRPPVCDEVSRGLNP